MRRYRLITVVWVVLGVSVATYVVASVTMPRLPFSPGVQPFYIGVRPLGFFDLRVYRGAGLHVLHGLILYQHPIVRRLGFTYPPFAAMLMTPLALGSLRLDKIAITTLSIVSLVWTLRRALMLGRPNTGLRRILPRDPATAWAVAAAAAAAALWLEPVTVTLGYGQVDLLLTALVVFDLSRPDSARTKGVAIGLAAAVKLTPLAFLVYLLCSGRRRSALVGLWTFAASIGLSFLLVPADAGKYWGGLVFKSSRVGSAINPGNQSLRAALARLLAERYPGPEALAVVAVVAVVGIALAVRAARRGDEAMGFSLCAVTTLLVSPVSWTHHWALVVPALLLLAVAAYEQRRLSLAVTTALFLMVGYAYLPERYVASRLPLGGLHTLVEDPYVLAGLLALALPVGTMLGRHLRADRTPESTHRRGRRARSQRVAAGAAPQAAPPRP